MRCLTHSECSEWLVSRSIAEDPYRSGSSVGYYLQFYAPAHHSQVDAFARSCFERVIPDETFLIQVTDWSLYRESEMIPILGIRRNSGECRPLIESPGHLLESSERELGVALFGLPASFGWSSYVYGFPSGSTIYNWEGEIYDFWTDSRAVFNAMKIILQEFDLNQTTEAERAGADNRCSDDA